MLVSSTKICLANALAFQSILTITPADDLHVHRAYLGRSSLNLRRGDFFFFRIKTCGEEEETFWRSSTLSQLCLTVLKSNKTDRTPSFRTLRSISRSSEQTRTLPKFCIFHNTSTKLLTILLYRSTCILRP